jgi:16S rRNA (cytosine967-C5)-methyltransferase
MSARLWAYEVLETVLHTPRHLEPVLEEALNARPQADPRDKALASRLVYTVLRHKTRLEFILNRISRYNRLERRLQTILLLGSGELLLFRTAAYAVVSSWVNLSRRAGLSRAGGLVNAVLRSLDRLASLPLPPNDEAAGFLNITYSHPRWLVEEWLRQWGYEATVLWLEACQEIPPSSVRVNTLRISPEALAAEFKQAGAGAEIHPLHPWSLLLTRPAACLPGFAEGWWQGQNPGATALTAWLAPEPGSRVLDMCAGTGGKSGQLAQHMRNQGELLALDISAGRARAWRRNMARLGVNCACFREGDAAALKPEEVGKFDYILLDAPCSCLGTTGSRPDVRWKKNPASVDAAAAGQRRLLRKAAELLAPGGRMLYATCTTAFPENDGNIEWLLRQRPELRPRDLSANPGGYWRTYPEPRQSDGFFAACLEKK